MKLATFLLSFTLFVSCGKKEETTEKKTSNTVSCTTSSQIYEDNSTTGQIEMLSSCYDSKTIGETEFSVSLDAYDSLYYSYTNGVLYLSEYPNDPQAEAFYPVANNNGIYGSWKANANMEGSSCDFTATISSNEFTFSGKCSEY